MNWFKKKIIFFTISCLFFIAACSPLKSKRSTSPLLSNNSTSYNEKPSTVTKRIILENEESEAQPLEKEVTISPQEIEKIEKTKKVNSSPISKKRTQPNKTYPFHFVLQIKETKYTKKYFDYYARLNRRTFERWLRRAEPYLPYILKIFRKEGIPDDLAFLPFAESGFNPFAYSRAGAVGIWQFMAATARKYGLIVNWWIDERRDPYKSTVAAAKYLKSLYGIFQDWYLVLAAYNSGEGKILRAIRKSKKDSFFDIAKTRYLHRETRLYVPKFMAILKIVENLDALGFQPLKLKEEDIPHRIYVKGGVDLSRFASLLGLSWKKFKHLNPQFKRYVTPPDIVSVIYLPPSLSSKAHRILALKKIRPYGGLIRYRIRKGDSWWRISRRVRVPIYILKKINRTHSNFLTPGRFILIPKTPSNVYLASWSHSFKRTYPRVFKDREWIKKRGNYIVKRGDTLWKISREFNVPISTLRKANGLRRSAILRVGMKLYIPRADNTTLNTARRALRHILYKVKKGDNLWNIARKFGVTTGQLISWNNLKKDSRIYPGDKIKIFLQD